MKAEILSQSEEEVGQSLRSLLNELLAKDSVIPTSRLFFYLAQNGLLSQSNSNSPRISSKEVSHNLLTGNMKDQRFFPPYVILFSISPHFIHL